MRAQGSARKEPSAFAEDPAALNFWPVGPRAVYGPGAGAAALRARLWNSDPTGQQARRASALCAAALAVGACPWVVRAEKERCGLAGPGAARKCRQQPHVTRALTAGNQCRPDLSTGLSGSRLSLRSFIARSQCSCMVAQAPEWAALAAAPGAQPVPPRAPAGGSADAGDAACPADALPRARSFSEVRPPSRDARARDPAPDPAPPDPAPHASRLLLASLPAGEELRERPRAPARRAWRRLPREAGGGPADPARSSTEAWRGSCEATPGLLRGADASRAARSSLQVEGGWEAALAPDAALERAVAGRSIAELLQVPRPPARLLLSCGVGARARGRQRGGAACAGVRRPRRGGCCLARK